MRDRATRRKNEFKKLHKRKKQMKSIFNFNPERPYKLKNHSSACGNCKLCRRYKKFSKKEHERLIEMRKAPLKE